MINSIPLNTFFHSPKHAAADNAKKLITLTDLSKFKQLAGELKMRAGLPNQLVDQFSIDMHIPTACVESCLEWVCRVNNLDSSQLRILALANIMAGCLYEKDILSHGLLDEIEHLHNNPHSLDLKPIEMAIAVLKNQPWDCPAITSIEITVMKVYAPKLTDMFCKSIGIKNHFVYKKDTV